MNTETLTRDNILDYAKEHFGNEPEYLWERTPEAAVLRHPENRKWYAVIMEVDRAKLGLPGAGPTEIAVVKCDPLMVGALRSREGFLAAYHMNKERWLTLRLDDTVEREEGLRLLEMSFALTRKKMKKAPRRAAQSEEPKV